MILSVLSAVIWQHVLIRHILLNLCSWGIYTVDPE